MYDAIRPITAAVLAFAAVLAPSAARGDEANGSTDVAVERLQAWLDAAAALEGRFEQQLVSGVFGDDRVESGRLTIVRPGRMRWDYEDPERKVAVVRDGVALLHLPEESQFIRSEIPPDEGTLHALLAGRGRVEELFSVAAAPASQRGRTVLRLRPRDATESFEEVALTVVRRTGAIVAAEVTDPAGNVMRYRFFDLSEVALPDPSLFELAPPPGTEILEAG